jgi:excisionase family DNA binding protein
MKYLSTKEFASELRVHPSTVIRGIQSGHIHAIRVGRGKKAMYRIPDTEFLRMLEFDLRNVLKKMVKEKDFSLEEDDQT